MLATVLHIERRDRKVQYFVLLDLTILPLVCTLRCKVGAPTLDPFVQLTGIQEKDHNSLLLTK